MDKQARQYRRWTMWTVLLAALISMGWRAWAVLQLHRGKMSQLILQLVIFAVFTVFLYLFLYHSGHGRWHSVLAYAMSIVFLNLTSILLADLLTMLHNSTHLPALIMAPLGILLMVGIAILFAKVVLPEIKSTLGRTLMLLFVVFSAFGLYPTMFWSPMGLAKHGILGDVIDTNLMGILIFVLASFVFAPLWHIKLPRWRFNKNLRWSILLIAVVVGTAYVIFNGFSTADQWQTLLTHWAVPHYPKLNLFYQALEAGIGEEWLHRGLIVSLLLTLPQHWAHRSPFTLALISGAIFGLWHITNLVVQNVPATVNQMISAFGGGLFMAALYFYSGSISLAILMHTMTDLMGFFATGTVISTTPNLYQWEITIITTLIFVAAAALLTMGKQRAVAQQTLDSLT